MDVLKNEMVDGWQEMKDDEKVAWVLVWDCRNGNVRRVLQVMWERRLNGA